MKATKITAALALSLVAVASHASGNEPPFRLNESSRIETYKRFFY